jgi:AcrR family transcriptional regulator
VIVVERELDGAAHRPGTRVARQDASSNVPSWWRRLSDSTPGKLALYAESDHMQLGRGAAYNGEPRMAVPSSTRRAEICRTAAQIFLERGFDATSVSDIADALGITKAGLYHYIDSKEALLFEIMMFGMDQIDAEVIAPVRSIRDPEERLRQIIIRHASIAVRARGAVAQLGDEIRALPAAPRRKIERRMRGYFDLVRDTLSELAAARRLRNVDVTVAAFSVLGMVLWLPRWFRPGRTVTADKAASEIANLALQGLLLPSRNGYGTARSAKRRPGARPRTLRS